jgi:hypothetical protein
MRGVVSKDRLQCVAPKGLVSIPRPTAKGKDYIAAKTAAAAEATATEAETSRAARRERHMTPEKDRTTINEVFDSICDFEELYAAYRDARKQKRYRRDVMEYAEQLEANLITTQNELIWGTYEVGPYRPFYVTIPKLRLVMALQFRDRVVQHALYRRMNPFYDKLFIEDSYACRIGKGSHKAADRLQYWMRQVSRKPGAPWYYLKLGIASNHGDVMHWFPKHGKNMDTFRAAVKALLATGSTTLSPTVPAPTPTATTGEEKIWKFFKDKGLNDFAIAGLMGNLYAESGLRSNNLQNTYEKSLGMTDEHDPVCR